MRCRQTAARETGGVLPGVLMVTLAAVGVAYLSVIARADILHLTSGGSVEGTIVEQDGRSYTVRTVVGMVAVPADAVDRIEKKPSVLDEYVKRRDEAGDTAAAQVALAGWCGESGLGAARRAHLKRAIELNPDCEAAREALGFVRVGGIWVDGRGVEGGSEGAGQAEKTAVGDATRRESDELGSAIEAQWAVQIRAIKKNKLMSRVDRLVEQGREKILRINDPLAISPLARVLIDGNWACREALVAALSQFPQDEATMDLALLSVLDADEEIRRRALVELKRRDDPRVIPRFRRALSSDRDELIKRAAVALGELEASAAVPELIGLLTARREAMVPVPVQTYFWEFQEEFDEPTLVTLGSIRIRHLPVVPTTIRFVEYVFHSRFEYQRRRVTQYRSEVREALRAITGEDFGFDAAAWRRWYEEQRP